MHRKVRKRYGRMYVMAESQFTFDNIVDETDEDKKSSPFCSSDSAESHSLFSENSPVKFAKRQTRQNLTEKNKNGFATRANNKQESDHSKYNSHSLFYEDSLVLCTPIRNRKQRNRKDHKTNDIATNNYSKQQTVSSKQATHDSSHDQVEKLPDFDDIAQDELIISSTPYQTDKPVDIKLSHSSFFSCHSPDVISAYNHLSGINENCNNITYRRGRHLSQSKVNECDNITFDLSELTHDDSSELLHSVLYSNASVDSWSHVDDLTNSLHSMCLRSHGSADKHSHKSLGVEISAEHSSSSSVMSACEQCISCQSRDQQVASLPLIVEVDSDSTGGDDGDVVDTYGQADSSEVRLPDCTKESKLSCTNEDVSLVEQMSFSEKLSTSSLNTSIAVTAEERVFSLCNQTQPLPFSHCISTMMMSKCVKIGEGVYGEVFRTFSRGKQLALKIIPIEGDFEVNGCPQKRFDEILPEIVIAKELSDLTNSVSSQTKNFCQVERVSCVQGLFPSKLLEQWDLYSQKKVSENDRPDIFPNSQLFIVFEFLDGGCPLENYQFLNYNQTFSVLRQVVFALAAAENELEFEHRDLHIGNVLVSSSKQPAITFKIQNKTHEFPTEGVTATIIDFTISRLKKDRCAVFCDVSTDEGLFEGDGDFQFDVYRDMRTENLNDWHKFCPHSNVLWVNYLCKKMTGAIKYKKNVRSSRDVHRHMKSLVDNLLQYPSCRSMSQDNSLWLPEFM